MSYFDDASLVMIPSGYKTSKVYSVKPTDGTGDLTFSRSNDTATRVNSAGLIEKVRTNLILQSAGFSTASWDKVTTTVSANTTANPLDGTVNADTITLGAGTTQKFVAQVISLNGNYTVSVYLKAGTHQFAQILLGTDSTPFANFDLVNGTASASGSTATIVSAGNGWYRCSMAFSTSTGNSVFILASDSLATSRFQITSSTGTLIAFGYQVETGDIATDYIATTSAAVSVGPVANVPRLDYLNSSCPRLLLEPQRTNLGLWSEQFNNAGWTNASTTITANYGVSPDGYTNADRFQQTTIGALQQTISVTASTAYTVSFYCKLLGGTSASLGVYNFNSNTFIFQDNLFSSLVLNQWVRVTRTFTTPVGCTSITGELWRDSTIDCLVYGFQLEAGAYATSYIPTLGSTSTRGFDLTSKTGISSLIGQTAGTIFVDFVWNGLQSPAAIDAAIFSIGVQEYGTSSIAIANYNGTMYARVTNGVTAEATINFGSLVAGTRYKAALAYANNDVVFYVNGVSYGSDTSASIPATGDVNFQNAYTNAKSVNQALLFKTRLSNADLAALTA